MMPLRYFKFYLPRFYRAFQGVGFAGFQTGLVLMEKLRAVFNGVSDITEQETEVAYNRGVELRQC